MNNSGGCLKGLLMVLFAPFLLVFFVLRSLLKH